MSFHGYIINIYGVLFPLLQCICSLVNISHGPCYATLVTLKRLQHHCGADALCREEARNYTVNYFITHVRLACASKKKMD